MEDRQAARIVPKTAGTPHRLHKSQVPYVGKGRPLNQGVTESGIPVPIYKMNKKVPVKKTCAGNEGTCKAWPVKGGLLCAGHLRSVKASDVSGA